MSPNVFLQPFMAVLKPQEGGDWNHTDSHNIRPIIKVHVLCLTKITPLLAALWGIHPAWSYCGCCRWDETRCRQSNKGLRTYSNSTMHPCVDDDDEAVNTRGCQLSACGYPVRTNNCITHWYNIVAPSHAWDKGMEHSSNILVAT